MGGNQQLLRKQQCRQKWLLTLRLLHMCHHHLSIGD